MKFPSRKRAPPGVWDAGLVFQIAHWMLRTSIFRLLWRIGSGRGNDVAADVVVRPIDVHLAVGRQSSDGESQHTFPVGTLSTGDLRTLVTQYPCPLQNPLRVMTPMPVGEGVRLPSRMPQRSRPHQRGSGRHRTARWLLSGTRYRVGSTPSRRRSEHVPTLS